MIHHPAPVVPKNEPDAVAIPLSNGMTAWVSRCDARRIARLAWNAHKRPSGVWYARRTNDITMQSVVFGPVPAPLQIDHIDGDGLNNTRSNLRTATRQQQSANRPRFKRKGLRGVECVGRLWRAAITVNRKTIRLGSYDEPVKAAAAYDEAALKHFGEFAVLNRDIAAAPSTNGGAA